MEEQFDEDAKDWRKTKIIGIDQIMVAKEPFENFMSQQVMQIFIDNDYIVS